MIIQRAKYAGIPPWELCGLPDSRHTIFWSQWIGMVATAEAEAKDTLNKQAVQQAASRAR